MSLKALVDMMDMVKHVPRRRRKRRRKRRRRRRRERRQSIRRSRRRRRGKDNFHVLLTFLSITNLSCYKNISSSYFMKLYVIRLNQQWLNRERTLLIHTDLEKYMCHMPPYNIWKDMMKDTIIWKDLRVERCYSHPRLEGAQRFSLRGYSEDFLL